MILQQLAMAVLLISYHPLKGVKFTLKLLIMIFFFISITRSNIDIFKYELLTKREIRMDRH